MTQLTRKEIELEIRQLSYEIWQDVMRQQREEGIIPGKLDINKVQEMVDRWHELEKYYLASIYNQSKSTPDFEMSMFVVFNYIEWQDTLASKMINCREQGDKELAEKFEDLLDQLDSAMGEIRKAVWRNDEIEHQDVL